MGLAMSTRLQEQLINKAREEISEDGIVSVTTFIQMQDLGLHAEYIINQIENEEI